MKPTPLFEVSFDCGDGVTGLAVVDSVLNGTSSGGVRIAPDVRPEEVRTLAGEMTLKYAFCGLTRGGAKCGVRMPEGLAPAKRLELLQEVGRRLGPLIDTGIYYPGMDMNCGEAEMRAIYAGMGVTIDKMTDTSFFTAVFVAEAVKACREVALEAVPAPASIAIEGFGNVGRYLVDRLPPDAYRIVAISTIEGAVHDPDGFDPAALTSLRAQHGDSLVARLPGEPLRPKESLLGLPVDILIPSARVGSIHDDNVASVSARAVVPAANAPCTPLALSVLQEKGTLVLPGFVCNAGGVLGSSLLDRGVALKDIEALASGPYRRAVAALVCQSRHLDCMPTDLARRVASSCLETARGKQATRMQRVARRIGKRFRPFGRLLDASALGDAVEHMKVVEGMLTQAGSVQRDSPPVTTQDDRGG